MCTETVANGREGFHRQVQRPPTMGPEASRISVEAAVDVAEVIHDELPYGQN